MLPFLLGENNGILLNSNGQKYAIPLTSAKQKHKCKWNLDKISNAKGAREYDTN